MNTEKYNVNFVIGLDLFKTKEISKRKKVIEMKTRDTRIS